MILLNKKVVKDGSDSSLLDNYDLPGSMLNFTITSSNIHCIVFIDNLARKQAK